MRRRRRRDVSGRLFRRSAHKSNFDRPEHPRFNIIHEGKLKQSSAKSYARFQQRSSGRVLLANYKLSGQKKPRMIFEFGQNGLTFDTLEEAEQARKLFLAEIASTEKKGEKSQRYKILEKTKPAVTQKGFDSSEIMFQNHHHAKEFIKAISFSFSLTHFVGSSCGFIRMNLKFL